MATPEKIRERESYKHFSALLGKIRKKGGEPSLLLDVHALLDGYNAYRSQRASDYALESIKLVLKDFKAL